MATLRQKGSGASYFLDYRDIDGQRFRVDTGTTDFNIAQLWLSKYNEMHALAKLGLIKKIGRIDADVLAGREKKKQSLTLEEFRTQEEDRCRHDLELAEKTIRLNNLALNSFLGVAGNKKLADLTDEEVILWKRTLEREGKSKTTLAIYHRHLLASFNRAVKWDMVESNPFAKVEISKGEQKKNRDMSYEQVRALLAKIEQAGDRQFYTYVYFFSHTRLRRH